MATTHPTVPHPPVQQESLMDYTQHERTYNGFLAGIKYAIVFLVLMLVGLYFAVIAGQGAVGGVLILASLVAPVIMGFIGRR